MPLEREPDFKPDATKRLSHDDTRFALGRIAGFQYFIVAVFLFLITGFWVLQIRDGQSNSELAEHNRVKTVPVLAPRGKLLDRDGRVIVDNQSAFTLLLTRENLNLDHIDGIAAGLHLDPADTSRARQALRLAAQVRAGDDQAGTDAGGNFVCRVASRRRYLPGNGAGTEPAAPVSAQWPGGARRRLRR